MANSKKGKSYRKSWRRKYRKGWKWNGWKYTGYKKCINAGQRSSCTIRVPMRDGGELTQAEGVIGTVWKSVCPFRGSIGYGSVLANPLYQWFSAMYDEVKLDWVKIHFHVLSPVQATGLPSCNLCTFWDRNKAESGDGAAIHGCKNLPGFGVIKTFINNQVCSIKRSCYASTLQEKSTYHDCTLDYINGQYIDLAYAASSYNTNFFCPNFYFKFEVPNFQYSITVRFEYDAEYQFTFRNPKGFWPSLDILDQNAKHALETVRGVPVTEDDDPEVPETQEIVHEDTLMEVPVKKVDEEASLRRKKRAAKIQEIRESAATKL